MNSNVKSRIHDALADAPPDHTEKYLEWLMEVMKSYSKAAQKAVGLGVLVAAIFELAAASGPAELAIGPLKLSQGGAVLTFMPVVSTYLFLQGLVYQLKDSRAHLAMQGALQVWDSRIHDARLDVLAGAPSPLYWNTTAPLSLDDARTPFERIENVTSRILIGVLPLAYGAFTVHAFAHLFKSSGGGTVLIWMNLCAVVALVVIAVVFYVADRASDGK